MLISCLAWVDIMSDVSISIPIEEVYVPCQPVSSFEVPGDINIIACSQHPYIIGVDAGTGVATMWDGQTGQAIRELWTNHKKIVSLTISKGDQYVAAGDEGNMLMICELHNSRSLVFAHPGPIPAVVFIQNATHIVSGGGDGIIRIWRIGFGSEMTLTGIHTLSELGLTGAIVLLRVHSDDKRLCATHQTGDVGVWDSVDGTLLRRFDPTFQWLGEISVDPTFCFALRRSARGSIQIWGTESGQIVGELISSSPSSCCSYSWNGRYILTGDYCVGRDLMSEV